MKQIVTRFPPSPTGYLHVGGARTALFNWLYARHTGGKFILRIEDTDTERSTRESTDAILEALAWLGIDYDEGPYYQSKRFAIYAEYAQKLLSTGNAYRCTCSPEEIEAMRKKAQESGGKPKYDGRCRERNIPASGKSVIRLKAPLTGTTAIADVVKGNIVFQNSELDDFIIERSDGAPTYNFAVVVDDITMGINVVLRGDDHVNNTPKQILIYKALGAPLPVFGHVPMVLGRDKTRLSKRHGAMSVTAYRDMGYLPEALLNYLVRLGWSHGDQEFFTIPELIEKFNIENIGRSPGVFDLEKLMALNAEHIRAAAPGHISRHLLPHLRGRGIDAAEGAFLEGAIKTLQPRSKTLLEMADGIAFYFAKEVAFDPAAAAKFLQPAAVPPLELLIAELESIDSFSEKNLEAAFTRVMEATGEKLGKIAQPVRLALTGKTVSPGIFEIIAVLGKGETLRRLERALDSIRHP
jgi:glutamyl-tRNA synthetase